MSGQPYTGGCACGAVRYAVAGGTRVRLVHSGFVTPRNDSALKTMSEGWKKVVPALGAIAGEQTQH